MRTTAARHDARHVGGVPGLFQSLLARSGAVGLTGPAATRAHALYTVSGTRSRAGPFTSVLPARDVRDAHWVKPILGGEVSFGELTGHGLLRQPAWRGLRPDKSPDELARNRDKQ